MNIAKYIHFMKSLFNGAVRLIDFIMHINIQKIIKTALNTVISAAIVKKIFSHIRNHRINFTNTVLTNEETTTEKILNNETDAVNADGTTKKEEHDKTIRNIYELTKAEKSKKKKKDALVRNDDDEIEDESDISVIDYNFNEQEAEKARQFWAEMHKDEGLTADDYDREIYDFSQPKAEDKKPKNKKKKDKNKGDYSGKKSQGDIVSVSCTNDTDNTRRYPGTDPRISDEDMDRMRENIIKAEEERQKHLDPCEFSPTRGYGVYEPYDPDAVFDFSKPYMIRRDENGNEYYAHPWDDDVVEIWRDIKRQNYHPRKPPFRRFYVDPKVNYAMRNTWNPDRDYQKILQFNKDNPEIREHKDAADFITKTPQTSEEWDYLTIQYWKAHYEEIGAFIRHRNTPWELVPYNVEDYRFITNTDFKEHPFKDMAVSNCFRYAN